MLLNILAIYLIGIVVVGFLMLATFCENDLPLTDGMALATIVFYPIVAVALLIYGIIIAIKGLLDFIIVLFKGEIF